MLTNNSEPTLTGAENSNALASASSASVSPLDGATARNETALPTTDLLSLDLSPKIAAYQQQAANTLNGDGVAFIGTSENDVIYGNASARIINGDAGSDLIYGSASNDYIEGDFSGYSQNQSSNDIILGGDGKDNIRGNQGQDILFGGAGDDMLQGGLDNDVLWGGQGNDRLAGDGYFQAQGNDIFILARNSGKDTIVDFQVGVDRIGLAKDLALEHLEFSQEAGNTVIRDRVSNSDIAVLKQVNVDDMTPDAFIEASPTPEAEPAPTAPEAPAAPEAGPMPSAPTAPEAEAAPSLVRLALVDAKTNQVVPGYEDLSTASTIDLNSLNLDQYSIKAVVNEEHELAKSVESIKFESDLGQEIQSVAPYAMFGDRGGDFNGKAAEAGTVTLKATAHSADGAKGELLETVDLSYTLADSTPAPAAPAPTPQPAPTPAPAQPQPAPTAPEAPAAPAAGPMPAPTTPEAEAAPSLVRLALVDAKTNQVVPGYEDLSTASTIDLNSLNLDQYSIKAVVNGEHELAKSVESIKFESDLGQEIQSVAPYAMFGDRGGDFNGKAAEAGTVTLKATAHSADGAKGELLETVDLSYTLADSTPAPAAPAPTPQPAPTPTPAQPQPTPAPTPAAPGPEAGPIASGSGKPASEPLVTLALVNAKTDKVVAGYEDLSAVDTVDLEALNLSEYNIKAVVNPDHELADQAESIKFESNLGDRTESSIPYAMFGDRGGDFNSEWAKAGDVSIKATVYSADGAEGNALESVELNYTMTGEVEPAPQASDSGNPGPEAGPVLGGNTLWQDNFAGDWKQDWKLQSRGQWGFDNFQVRSDSTKSDFLRVQYPRGSASPAVSRSNGVSLGGGEFKANLGIQSQDSMRLSYDVRFSDNFDFVKGGKLPGLFGGNAPSGGDIPNGRDGFSTRMMWRRGGDGEVYAYLPSSRNYGTSIGKGKWSFDPGQWHNVQQEVVLNDPGKSNGTIRVWFDNQLVHEEKNVLFRTVDSLKVDGVYFSTFFGGGDSSWSTPKDVHADFANFSVSSAKR